MILKKNQFITKFKSHSSIDKSHVRQIPPRVDQENLLYPRMTYA